MGESFSVFCNFCSSSHRLPDNLADIEHESATRREFIKSILPMGWISGFPIDFGRRGECFLCPSCIDNIKNGETIGFMSKEGNLWV